MPDVTVCGWWSRHQLALVGGGVLGEWRDVDLGLWGKSRGLPWPYPVACHLLDAGAAVGALWDHYLSSAVRQYLAGALDLSEEDSRRLLIFWAALHDVGKVIPCFQAQEPKAAAGLVGYPGIRGERLGHDFAAHAWLGRALEAIGYPASDNGALAFQVAQMLGGHHGRFSPFGSESIQPLKSVPALGNGRWEEQRQALVHALHEIVDPPKVRRRLKGDVGGLICGLVILADWLVSQEGFLKAQLPHVPKVGDRESLTTHYERGQLVAPELLREAGLGRVSMRPGTFAEEFGFSPAQVNPLQASVEQALPGLVTGPGLLLVMAPMGIGKTEVALHASRVIGEKAGTGGFFFGLPTMATADHMHQRADVYGGRRAAGDAALTLLHSMAWLSDVYQPVSPGQQVLSGEDERASLAVTEWLRGSKRPILAPLAVGTIDQALVAVLSGRHNMLRMLGLTNKVFIVDEVHAYDAYMQGLLRRLLLWLGRLGVPVVLLSATLPRRTAERLVESYLEGAGREPSSQEIHYPGWLYADASTGQVTSSSVATPSSRLQASLHPVPVDGEGAIDRADATRALLRPAVEAERGCVGIICNTVAGAQETFRELRSWFEEIEEAGGNPPDLTLLHARFPGDQRKQITESVIAKYGKGGERPQDRASVLVATQVIEQSIDLDFDLIISDLAPIALLLQRAGRGWRHPGNFRPPWASGPHLAVLMPTASKGEPVVPRPWRYIYPPALLRRTRGLLEQRMDESIRIPEDVQELVEEVYDQDFADGQLLDDDIERLADEQVKEGIADMVVIPEPWDIGSLHLLTERDADDALFSTRLGAESGRVLCCYTDDSGALWLDEERTRVLPGSEHDPDKDKRLSQETIKLLLSRSIPVPGTWLTGRGTENEPPETWSKNFHLRRLVLLPHYVEAPGRIRPARLGGEILKFDASQGLVNLA